jgi:hypothetical protein
LPADKVVGLVPGIQNALQQGELAHDGTETYYPTKKSLPAFRIPSKGRGRRRGTLVCGPGGHVVLT